ncbi:hypothetical protein ACHHYP_03071 [Achlya hypogyna]|uniref:HAT C-terminal dimerisation domain-containing protein n=1 Tax=Achlya hypogyna TaxID=1202772 RepID=A0A1V9Z4Q7_ACHHY|nr:hypothetical protein ACHHYP_03071 [Achlya hypogyna]
MDGGFCDHPRTSDEVSNLKAKIHASLVAPGDDTYVVKANPALKKSECWQRFGHVYMGDELVKLHGTAFVACYVCHTVYSFKSKNGTTTIMAHRCPHERKARVVPVEKPRKIKNPELDALKKDIHGALLYDDASRGYTLQENPNATKSECWKKFGHVFLNGLPLHAFDSGFVACRDCFVVYQYKVRNGTSTMTTHVCGDDVLDRLPKRPATDDPAEPSKRPKPDLDTIAASLRDDGSTFALLPNPAERDTDCWQRFGFVYQHGALFTDAAGVPIVGCYGCKWLAPYKGSHRLLDSHACEAPVEKLTAAFTHAFVVLCQDEALPVELLARDGFRNFLQQLLTLGRSSTQSLDALLPALPAVQAALAAQVEMMRAVLSARLSMLGQEGVRFGLSLMPHASRVVVAVHYIDADFVLHDRVVDLADDWLSAVDKALARYNLSLPCRPHTTLCAPLAATPGVDGHPCPMDVLQAALDAICSELEWYGDTTHTFELLASLQELVAHGPVTKDDRRWELPRQRHATWGAMATAAAFALEHWDARAAWGPARELPKGLKDVLAAFQNLAAVFVQAAEAFAKAGSPTLHTVCYWKHALAQYCATPLLPGEAWAMDDTLSLARMKSLALKQLHCWPLAAMHVRAALLDPGQRRRLTKFGVDADRIALAKDELRTEMLAAAALQPAPVRRRKKPEPALLSMYGDSSDDDGGANSADAVDLELTKYFENPLVEEATPDVNLLLWWKYQQKRWPLLSKVARSTLSLPASPKPAGLSEPGGLATAQLSDALLLQSNRDLTRVADDRRDDVDEHLL